MIYAIITKFLSIIAYSFLENRKNTEQSLKYVGYLGLVISTWLLIIAPDSRAGLGPIAIDRMNALLLIIVDILVMVVNQENIKRHKHILPLFIVMTVPGILGIVISFNTYIFLNRSECDQKTRYCSVFINTLYLLDNWPGQTEYVRDITGVLYISTILLLGTAFIDKKSKPFSVGYWDRIFIMYFVVQTVGIYSGNFHSLENVGLTMLCMYFIVEIFKIESIYSTQRNYFSFLFITTIYLSIFTTSQKAVLFILINTIFLSWMILCFQNTIKFSKKIIYKKFCYIFIEKKYEILFYIIPFWILLSPFSPNFYFVNNIITSNQEVSISKISIIAIAIIFSLRAILYLLDVSENKVVVPRDLSKKQKMTVVPMSIFICVVVIAINVTVLVNTMKDSHVAELDLISQDNIYIFLISNFSIMATLILGYLGWNFKKSVIVKFLLRTRLSFVTKEKQKSGMMLGPQARGSVRVPHREIFKKRFHIIENENVELQFAILSVTLFLIVFTVLVGRG